ncbi:MAG: M20/M25/M40 family metallo-hydrolase [Pirellulaceae bacterium]|nr:M20/M25/M40 family metallo-hydrolase [Pirellulaceae bacterium]
MEINDQLISRVAEATDEQRLLRTAIRLIEVPSPTRSAADAADCLAEMLEQDGFAVQRPEAGWATSPAVVARWGPATGRTLQLNGHLDTVHLPFVPPSVREGILRGSGASDMKGGIAAMVEALRIVRHVAPDLRGSVLLTAHDLHESPWGDGSQVDTLIAEGFLGDGVLLPEYLSDRVPIIGRGLAVLDVALTRGGQPVHEVLGGMEQPSVIRAGGRLIGALETLDAELAVRAHPLAGRDSLFVGRVAAGEIFNQAPVRFELSGTRRWLPGTDAGQVRRQFEQLVQDVAQQYGVQAEGRFLLARDAFEISAQDPLVAAFQRAHRAIAGQELPLGAKPFVDDGNAFVRQGGVPAITHGPDAHGAHTVDEWVPVAELVRVARVYALTALAYCESSA